ncbi:MAG: hypothetical protein EAZ97_11960 [Bacteroidetes bacterium]|nr:MAG: hypothetical protein EAZ97_11960 [Bacteroidota bacterium]
MFSIDPDKRAKELHSLISPPMAQNFVTIAVLTTENETVIIGTNERKLRKKQVEALLENEIEAQIKEDKHAEEKVIQKALEMGLKGKEIGASRPICLDCEDLIKEESILPKTELKGKKSKKRQ